MCIYCGTNKYRKIYENHVGPIPKDQNGRTYEIHHVDGNRKNNYPDNLIALSILEHYNIHYSQGDYNACLLISRSMTLTVEELSELARLGANKRILDGTHHFLNPEWKKEATQTKKERGTCLFTYDNPGKNPKNKKFGDDNVSRRPDVKGMISGENHYMHKDGYDKSKHNSKNPETLAKRSGDNHWMSKPDYRPDLRPGYDSTVYKFTNESLNITVEMTKQQFRNAYKLNSGSVCNLVRGRVKSCSGWRLVN